MKKPTGKPPRKPYTKVQPTPIPFDPQRRHTVEQAMAYLSVSRFTLYEQINAGLLEAFKEGRRTYITGRSIAARFLPPTDNVTSLPKPFVPSPRNSAKPLPTKGKRRLQPAPTKKPRRQTRLDDANSPSSAVTAPG